MQDLRNAGEKFLNQNIPKMNQTTYLTNAESTAASVTILAMCA
jgi:hypothetical protein